MNIDIESVKVMVSERPDGDYQVFLKFDDNADAVHYFDHVRKDGLKVRVLLDSKLEPVSLRFEGIKKVRKEFSENPIDNQK